MNDNRNRRWLNAGLGVFLLAVVGIGVIFLRGRLLSEPIIAVQIGLLGVASLCNIAAATDRLSTTNWGWYRWSGLGNVCLGASLPAAFVGDEPILLAVIGVGALSLVAIGLDMLLFHGEYMHGEGFSHGQN